jgi:hypothetical protein
LRILYLWAGNQKPIALLQTNMQGIAPYLIFVQIT